MGTRGAGRLAALWLALAGVLAGGGAMADEAALSALARFDAAHSTIRDAGDGTRVELQISQPVPWRLRVMADPPRLVMDFREVDWAGIGRRALSTALHVSDLRAGLLRPGWSRLVLQLDGPFRIASAEMRTGGQGARVVVALRPTGAAAFAAAAAAPDPADWALPPPAEVPPPKRRQTGDGPVVVALDPGHGGIDPGAESGKLHEADIVLAFARELKELLVRSGFVVVMTRDEDVFVPLETRLSIARAAGADVFLSIHADSLAEGDATGATVYTLADRATDTASEKLAERHDRDDLLAGVDLTRQDDVVAGVLMDMVRTETMPRSARLAHELVAAVEAAGLRMHKRPHQEAAFSVLKAPDIPAALLELGFLSSKDDQKNLTDPDWRAKMAQAVAAALRAWAAGDAAEAALLRQ